MTAYRVTFPRVLRAEWTKLWSLRSTWITLGAVAPLAVAVAGGIGWNAARDPAYTPTVADAVGGSFLGMDLLSLVLGVFGILLVTGEYTSGLIRATLAAVPRRWPVPVAKAAVFAAATFPLLLAVCLAGFLANQAFADPAVRVPLTEPEVLRATLGAAAAPVGFGLLGLGIGAVLRHTAGAITGYVAALLVLPALLPALLTDRLQEAVLPYVPPAAGQGMYAVGDANPFRMLPPGPAALVLAGWVVLALLGGVAVLVRRDA